MRIPGLKHLERSARWVRSRFSGGALILGYHRISNDGHDYYSQCIHPQHFAEHLHILRKQANPIPLIDLVRYLSTDTLPPKSVVITLDDGYADNLYQASPLLAQFDIPATIFVSTGYLGKHFWWDELAWLIMENHLQPGVVNLLINSQTHSWLLSEQDKAEFLKSLYLQLLPLTSEARDEVMTQLRQQIGVNVLPVMKESRALTTEELTELGEKDLITIGAHTVTHPVLTSLREESQRFEIEQCKQDLEVMLKESVDTFSYPNGAGDETTKRLLKQIGFNVACASFNDVARAGNNPFFLPRFWPPDQGRDDFAQWLNLWL